MFVTESFDSALRGISAADYRVVEGTDLQSAMYLWRQMDGFLLGDSSFRPLQHRVAMTRKLTEFYPYAQSMLDMNMEPFHASVAPNERFLPRRLIFPHPAKQSCHDGEVDSFIVVPTTD
ncbi:uncharacterized protein LOC135388784 isoform X2 [Ornithodoros turicata]|uniref:uncharacterized protein LOC135388784 isoform X2 n=1 Tax=Ornithodoros turicata TaxID=34597 RepID=UPI003138C40A